MNLGYEPAESECLCVWKVRVQCFGSTAQWWLFTAFFTLGSTPKHVSYGGSFTLFRAVGCVVVSYKSV